MKLSVVLIVKNEEVMLPDCIESVKDADEIVIVDTGSTDNTKKLLQDYHRKNPEKFVISIDEYTWKQHYAEARNFANSKATGDWILSIDADEILEGGITRIREEIEKAGDKKTVDIFLYDQNGSGYYFPKVYKNHPDVQWCGRVHNHLNIAIQNRPETPIKISRRYSPAHKKDPHRAFKMLLIAVKEEPKSARYRYYLGREYTYLSEWKLAIEQLDECVKLSNWEPEVADALYLIAQSHLKLGAIETAHKAIMQTIKINPNFKMAIEMMVGMIPQEKRAPWIAMARKANNKGVLFDRMPMIELCMCVYQRPDNIQMLINELNKQTIQNFRLNIWNNSGKELDVSGFPENRVKVINSKTNEGSAARFKLVPLLKSTPIVFIDDDEVLGDTFLEDMYYYWREFGGICGWYTRTWEGENYWEADSAVHGSQVDYVGTGGMITDHLIFNREPSLQNIPENYSQVEDLYLSYLARKNGIKLTKVNVDIQMENDGLNQYENLREYKQKAFKSLRKEGWKLLKDNAK